jgi:hypothetical protein
MTSNEKNYYSEWYSKNKEKHLCYLKEKINCEACNKLIVRSYLSIHKKTKNHILNSERLKIIKESDNNKKSNINDLNE